MADRGDTHYRGLSLHRWFAFSSLLLLLSVFWMVVDDFYAPWKKYQREFYELDTDRTRAAIESEDMQSAARRETELLNELAQIEEDLLDQRGAIDEKADEVFQLGGTYKDDLYREKKLKEDIGYSTFFFEEWVQHNRPIGPGDAEYDEKKGELDAMFDELYARTATREGSQTEWEGAQDELAALTAVRDDKEKEAKDAAKELDLLRVKLDKLAPEGFAEQMAKLVRDDIPGLDFVGPNIKVDKVVLANLSLELNFTKGQRIDMCRTCHLGIDKGGWEGEEQPYSSHPRLDLYLSSSSPHPFNDVGCTICHRGAGQALEFTRADHRPSDVDEAADWLADHGWHKQKYWDYPMLSTDYVEASCVQCHKDSMELIAEDAPRVSEGYQAFERYGCYACHKVEWFPEKRRPGPSLTDLHQKFGRDWAAAWIADPKAFRPTTWMPQFFHLENFAPDEVVARSDWGRGRDIMGQEWNEAAVTAVTEFLFANHVDRPLPPVPVEGDVARGREEFRLVGCLACHNVAAWEETDLDLSGFPDPALMRRGENEHGPNLRGIATKVDPTWLYWWLKDPTTYWPDTRMPDLRLSDQQAADIVAYMMDPEDREGFFLDTPDGWAEGFPEIVADEAQLREVLMEQARWFFMRDGRATLDQRFGQDGDWADTPEGLERLTFDVGQRFVQHQGCFSCHDIDGMQDAMPIGAELTNWGSKTVDKLDWGFVADHLAVDLSGYTPDENYNKWFKARKGLKSYREPWIEQKLGEPRSFDREKVKAPLDRLRMPWFDFSEEEKQALATFVVGLVDDEVQRARMVPTPEQASIDHGLRVIRNKNCAGCHVIEPGEVDFLDLEGNPHTVGAELTIVDEDSDLPPLMDRFDEYIADYEAWWRDPEGGGDEAFEVEEIILRLLRTEPDQVTGPMTGEVGNSVILEPGQITDVRPAWGGSFVDVVTNYYRKGIIDDPEQFTFLMPDPTGGVFDVDGEPRYYYEESYDKLRWTFAPPVLIEEGRKVQADWFYEFLLDPMPIRPQMRVRMPSFTWGPGEAQAVVDAFAVMAAEGHEARFARKLRTFLGSQRDGMTVDELAAMVNAADPSAALSGATVRGIEDGDANAITAGWEALEAFAQTVPEFFQNRWGPVATDYEHISRRLKTYTDTVAAKLDGTHFDRATILALDERDADGAPVGKGVNCTTCHFLHGEPPPDNPIAWAPELYQMRERLREDWTEEWIKNPLTIYPGTAMPANFPDDPDPEKWQWQQAYPGSPDDQVQAVLDWLYNLDRVYPPQIQ